jgi:hypothetical protein
MVHKLRMGMGVFGRGQIIKHRRTTDERKRVN